MKPERPGRVVPIRLTEWELDQVEMFASRMGARSIGLAVKHALITHVLESLSKDEESDEQTMQEALRKISKMADLALDFEVKSNQ